MKVSVHQLRCKLWFFKFNVFQASVYSLIQFRYRAQTATTVLGVFNLQILALISFRYRHYTQLESMVGNGRHS